MRFFFLNPQMIKLYMHTSNKYWVIKLLPQLSLDNWSYIFNQVFPSDPLFQCVFEKNIKRLLACQGKLVQISVHRKVGGCVSAVTGVRYS